MPPGDLLLMEDDHFQAAPELEAWMRQAFIEGDLPTVNPDHSHLAEASIGVLWTNAKNKKGGKIVGGTAEMPSTQGDLWKRGRFAQQNREWFGCEPTFIITISAPLAVRMNHLSFCALVEHELYHCGQKLNKYGEPMFSRADGSPIFFLRPHDVEEFTPIAARYGVGACAGDSIGFVKAANATPLFGLADLDCACGACGR